MWTQNFQTDIQKTIINVEFYEKYIYEVLKHNTTAGVQLAKDDFILSTIDQIFDTTIDILTFKTKNIIGKIQPGLTN